MHPIGTADTVAEYVVSLLSMLLLDMPGVIIKGSSFALIEIYAPASKLGGCYCAAETSQVFNVELLSSHTRVQDSVSTTSGTKVHADTY
ncbi:hypothetical protein GJ744_010860 [Endocarpon pusillum]|uniref:Uncharacterized protein n=1 Tax=Endocarpon pusillum TaxID=364733 RepID=A0A8H7E3V8_9EURO|nr:hypothetical protein GJ744_010860 [Endocarpon pusillum]